ncbi:low-specificity L-threonine aldolase [Aneurinibacillus sp. Ricciae_BoGa-3]|nr:low-specificity L-threonine aldolase [Aneurinibacillus sp. Ricciae_BoGa-3]WCK56751.1 low-specificity L-threonine aldolase [Aneurinibacillus sp. Ricciae_BoGa-3]
MIDFRSDTLTKPTEEMRRLMYEAEVGDDVYGEDPTVRRLEERAAEMLGHEDALFVTSGTQGNQVALLTHCRVGEEIILEADAHIFLYEGAGPAALGGIQLHTVAGTAGVLSVDDVRKAVRDENDIHQPRTRLICVENTHNKAGGRVIPVEKLRELYLLARERSIQVHMDGARLFNAVVASGTSAQEYGEYVDSAQICLSKGLSAPIGSVLTGSKEFITEARRWRKRLGGGMRQAGVIAAPGLYALEHMVDRLEDDHHNAKKLAQYLGSIPGLQVNVDAVETNILMCDITASGLSNDAFQEKLTEAGVRASNFGEGIIRFVTHRHITAEDVEETYSRLSGVLKGLTVIK